MVRKLLFQSGSLCVCGEHIWCNSLFKCVLFSCHSCQYVCGMCLDHKSSVMEKVEFKSSENVKEERGKLCWHGNMFSLQDVTFEDFECKSLYGIMYQCCVRHVLLYCSETWKLTFAELLRLRVERLMITVMCGVILMNGTLSDTYRGRVGVVVKIEDV